GFVQTDIQGDALHILELAVRRDHQGRGIGGALMRAALEAGRQAGLARATLTTFAGLSFNEAFYRRLGFVTLAAPDARLAAILASEAAHGLTGRCAMARPLRPA
ncbi:GNAT family N-acetyltransferase, partial [Bordetella hinzii]|nr:GNAT family N-acetyltransferase [Bordetella hinzii]